MKAQRDVRSKRRFRLAGENHDRARGPRWALPRWLLQRGHTLRNSLGVSLSW